MSAQATEQKISILIIDDEPAVHDALKLVFESKGYDVEVAENGGDGIKIAIARPFRVAIIDLFLPDMLGLQAIKVIRAQQPEISIILISGNGTPQTFTDARNLGAVGILAKPFSPTDILQLIRKVLEQ
ncbi:MAG: hypothetical protein QOK48_2077 [Blastocatellia bacterium]|nr:hypothetical protein [Blastocatellia bacterium]